MLRSKYLQPKKYFHFLVKKIKSLFSDLENHGERVDIFFKKDFLLDENEKCHLKRYNFAKSYIKESDNVGDFACGTGYGSAILATKAESVVGLDIDGRVIEKIKERYKEVHNLEFLESDLLKMDFENKFDTIVSFETIEHLKEEDILKLLALFHKALKSSGKLIISTPYMQKNDKRALQAGFHQTFFVDEKKIDGWMKESGFKVREFYYQSYDWPAVSKAEVEKEFIISVAEKI